MIASDFADMNLPGVFAMAIPVVAVVAVFTYMSILGHSEQRRKEREVYYRYEFERKIVEQHGIEALDRVNARKREEELAERRRRHESVRMSGLVLIGIGAGLLLGLQWVPGSVWQIGWIPMFMGASLLVYALLQRRQVEGGAAAPPPHA